MKKGEVVIAERNYTYSEMRAMQQDAIRRVNEMQRLAQQRVGATNQSRQDDEHQEAANEVNRQNPEPQRQSVHPMPREPQNPPQPLRANSLEGFIRRLGLDSDQLLLLGLMLLLINEGADTVLILAIFYMVL